MKIQGFYTDKKGKQKAEKNTCASCGLYQNVITYKMPPSGEFKKGILNLGESPGEAEDKIGKQWQGKVGRVLKRTYKRMGIDLFEDCININSVNCRPDNNRKPTKKQITCCRNMIVDNVINEYQPDIIMLFGSSALESFLGHKWHSALGGINKWRGFTIPDREHKAWICPVFHPSYIARMDEEVELIWKQDLQRAINKVDTPLPKYVKPEIEFIDDLSVLLDINKNKLCAVDFETTGIKPQAKGHRIETCAIADDIDHAYVFVVPKKRKDQKLLLEFLSDHERMKVAANMKYEHVWAKERLGIEIRGWKFDTMLGAHVLDNRSGVTGLDFQVYVNFGILDYSSDVHKYIRNNDDESANALNNIRELMQTDDGLEMLMKYNALDTIYELRLAWQQIKQLDYDLLPEIY